jgi:hypothetical protein
MSYKKSQFMAKFKDEVYWSKDNGYMDKPSYSKSSGSVVKNDYKKRW